MRLLLFNLKGKIRRVHIAAREGSLRDLQAALDRRKFSTARDEISPSSELVFHILLKVYTFFRLVLIHLPVST